MPAKWKSVLHTYRCTKNRNVQSWICKFLVVNWKVVAVGFSTIFQITKKWLWNGSFSHNRGLQCKCRVPKCPQPGLEPRLLDISRRAQWPWSHTPPTVHHSPSTKLFFWPEICCRLQSYTTKTSFASYCESLEIRLLDTTLKGRKWGNVYSTEFFSNIPTIKSECPGVELPYGQHWAVLSHIVKIIHGQYLKWFLLSQKRKNVQ